ncbi:MAG TPA: RNA polymerase sigma factor [Steroidobacteraceae bacterium]|jgi:RNA polymerase sigma-70 factor (ECF subfamily)|nr:RNA polymerase sigma factor [Steroidobacteraceae bacterium]
MSEASADDAFRAELAALLPRLRRFGRVITRNVADADDLVQVALEKALTHAGQWRPGSRMDSWMFGIMKNAWIDEVRARRRRERVHAPEEAGATVGDASAAARDIVLSVEAAMEQLPEEQRMAIALVLVEGLSYKDAAAALEIPIGTLTSRLARGRETLQALLGDGGSA